MSKTTYGVRSGFRITQEEADDVGPILVNLLGCDAATAENLVAACKKNRRAWRHFPSVDQAAELYWLTRAREFLRGIEIVSVRVVDNELEETRVVRLVHDDSTEDSSARYRESSELPTDRSFAQRARAEAKDELLAWVKRYEWLVASAASGQRKRRGVATAITLVTQAIDQLG